MEGAAMNANTERIRDALQFIPVGAHDERVRMAFMLKSEMGEAGRDLWDEWRGDRGSDEAASVWKSASETGPLKIGTLFHEAKANGWRDDGRHPMPTPEKLAEQQRINAERAAQAEAEQRTKHEAAMLRAAEILASATGDPATHPYAAKIKRGVPFGPRVKRGAWPQRGWPDALLIPILQADGKISSIEAINVDGEKDSLKDGKKASGFHHFGKITGAKRVLIGEGLATVAAGVDADGSPAAAALTRSNLKALGLMVRAKAAPDAEIIFLADHDPKPDGTNPGLRAAEDAARACGGKVATPGTDATPCDFWDLWARGGKDAVKQALATARIVGAGDTAKESPASSNSGVTEVTGVQPSNGAAFGCTPAENDGVTGVTKPPADTERPCFRVFDDWLEHDGQKYPPGVWFFGIKPAKGESPPALWQQRISSPLLVEAVTFDGQDNNFGRELRFKTTTGRWRTWAMPMEMLAGDGAMLRGELLSMGVEIDPTATARNLLASYLQAKPPKRRKRCALQTGWNGDSFVLPDTVIGPDAGSVIFQSGECGHDEHTIGGTLEGWQAEIAARAVGNPMLVIALSAAFAGPLLKPCNAESGGVHLLGKSSIGKTTGTNVACSTWGGENFRRSWRATANGMEGAAARFNDCLLALDDISEADPKEVGTLTYSLGNGTGKQRASRSGNARAVTRFRCMVLSNGERTIATTMAEGGHRAKAGQGVRLLDIPSERRFGILDELHGFPDGAAFSDAIKTSAKKHHGHAGRAFLEKLTHDKRDFPALLERIKALKEFSADGAEGQDKRAAGRFAMLALAGELATEYGITGWPEGEAIKAAAIGFTAWRSIRGKGSDERRKILEQVSSFIDKHGDGRFSDAEYSGETSVRDRAGWWRDSMGERLYLFTADGLKEALKGFDFKPALDTLQEAGALPAPGADGKRAKAERIKARGAAPIRLYTINPEKLGGDHGA
jgi:putative DNA primase/helicase